MAFTFIKIEKINHDLLQLGIFGCEVIVAERKIL